VTARSALAETFSQQAAACASLGSPLYEALLHHCADDIDAGGPVAQVLSGREDTPGPAALALRLLGAAHRLVLEGRWPRLGAHYPSVGGDGDAGAAWAVLHADLPEHASAIRALLDQPPQTNEVGRAAGLLGGLLHLADAFGLPVELHEIGSSAGLNLQADAFCYRAADGRHLWGPADSPVQLLDAWRGSLPPVTATVQVVRRLGSDVAPLDPTDERDSTTLLSYVWADMTARLDRLRAALAVARRDPVRVDALDAVAATRRLALVRGRTVVLWHSVMWQYMPKPAQAAVTDRLEELGAAAGPQSPLGHLFLEPTRRTPEGEHEFLVVLHTWPGERRVLGSAHGHGVPITWQ